MDFAEWFVVGCFVGFCVWLVVLAVRAGREDAEEERRRVHRMLVEMPREKADVWLRSYRDGPRCACGTYNLKYTTTVKANEADHQLLRCQPAWERIEVKDNKG